MTMPDVKVYVRTEDLDKWNAIEKKSQWLSVCLNTVNPKGTAEFKMSLKPGLVMDRATKIVYPVDVLKACKHGADPKFCKHTKNGKVCK